MTRLYLNHSLQAKENLTLDGDHSHYLARVLRYQVGAHVNVFNEKDGEWQSQIIEITKKAVIIQLEMQVRPATLTPPLWLAFSPLKNDAMGFLIEKATELGATHLQPILTERCNTQRLNLERMQKNAIEAAQQCERLDIPEIMAPLTLDKFLQNLPQNIQWCVALERAKAENIVKVLLKDKVCISGFIIGPEGGFTTNEVKLFDKYQITPINLGSRILRAETAALSVLAAASFIKEN